MPRTICIFAIAATWALLPGCGDKRDAHLDRFLDSQGALAGQVVPRADSKPESIDPFLIPEQPLVADRVNFMGFAEVATRLGAHRYRATTSFAFQSSETRASLREESLIVMAQNGDFRVKVENDGGQGYELLFSDSRFFARNRFGPFHERRVLSGDHVAWRDAAYGSWAAIYRLFRGRLSFTKLDLVRYNGRDAIRFGIGLSRQAARLPGTPEQPAIPEGVEKYVYPIVPTPSDTHRWRDKASPQKASGTLWVDADVGAVLKVDFTGRLTFAAPEVESDGGIRTDSIELTVSTLAQADGFGNPPSIAAPAKESVKPIPERIPVDTHPIDFYFGKGFTASLGAPAGVAAKAEEDQDDEKKKKPKGGSASKP